MNITTENKNTLEINIQSPSSPLVPLNVHNFVRDIDVPIDTKIETTTTMTGGTTTGGIFGFFTSFFQRFYPQPEKKDPYLNKVFSSGNIESKIDKQNDTIIIPQNKSLKTEPETELEKKNDSLREENDDDVDIDNQEITKIILTTEDPDIILNDSLKGTKLFYFTQRTEVPSQWV
jgi:hypothetical protein